MRIWTSQFRVTSSGAHCATRQLTRQDYCELTLPAKTFFHDKRIKGSNLSGVMIREVGPGRRPARNPVAWQPGMDGAMGLTSQSSFVYKQPMG
jgi:hypothetical protein